MVGKEDREMTLEEMNEEELWNEWDRVREEERKIEKARKEYIDKSFGATWRTVEDKGRYHSLVEKVQKAQEEEEKIRQALRELRGY